MFHVNPRLEHRGMLVVFNPLDREVNRTLRVPLYYTGLEESAMVRQEEGAPREHRLARDYSIALEVSVAPRGMTWFVITAPR